MRWLVPLVLLAACGPVPVEQAERQCIRRAELAERPRGEIGIGATSRGGTYTNLEISASSDYFMGRDPAAVYNACVYQKSGEMPSRPLYDRPDWRG